MQPIYIADDSADQRHLLGCFLKRINPNCQVMFFERAQELLDALSSLIETGGALPSIVIMDLQMPEINGYYALTMIQQLNHKNTKQASVPVAIYSSYSDPATVKKCLDAGAVAFLKKPADQDELKNLLISIAKV